MLWVVEMTVTDNSIAYEFTHHANRIQSTYCLCVWIGFVCCCFFFLPFKVDRQYVDYKPTYYPYITGTQKAAKIF